MMKKSGLMSFFLLPWTSAIENIFSEKKIGLKKIFFKKSNGRQANTTCKTFAFTVYNIFYFMIQNFLAGPGPSKRTKEMIKGDERNLGMLLLYSAKMNNRLELFLCD